MTRVPAHVCLVQVFLAAVAMFAFFRTGEAQIHHSNSHGVQPTTRAKDVDPQTQRILTDIEGSRRTTTTGPADVVSGGPEIGPDSGLLSHLREVYGPTLSVAWPSVLVALGLACAGGILGIFVVLRREALVALATPQIVTLGAAVGVRLGWPQLPPALAAVGVALSLLAWSRRRNGANVILPALYVAGVCLSILVIANAGAHLMEVQNLFTGIDVAVGTSEALIVTGLLLVSGGGVALLWRRWLLLAQSPTTAELARLHPVKWHAMFLGLLALVLVLATNAVGPIMVVALLFLPAATVLPWTPRVPRALGAAVAVALLSVTAGFVLSVEMEWPFSHSVGGAGFGLFLLSHLLSQGR